MSTYRLLIIAAAVLFLIGILSGCGVAPTMSDGEPGIQILPDIQSCKGKISLTATGSLSTSAGLGSNASNLGTLQADCGDGFSLIHGRPKP